MATVPLASRRQLILETLEQRVRSIRVANGYHTDAGAQVTLGEVPDFGPDDLPEAYPEALIVLVVGDVTPGYQGMNVYEELPVELQCLARVDLAHPHVMAERILTDAIVAVEQPEDRTLGGLVPQTFRAAGIRTIARQPGLLTVGVGITYVFPMRRAWGQP